jgi:hypothetical protein
MRVGADADADLPLGDGARITGPPRVGPLYYNT